MKKLLSLTLALIMVLTLSVAVFAAEDQDATFSLTYKLVNDGTSNPAETFTFTFTNGQVTEASAGAAAPAIPNAAVTFDAGTATVAGLEKQVSVALSEVEWPSVGIYTYDVQQVAGSTAGVTYSDVTAKLKVTVARDDATGEYYTAFVTLSLADDDKDGQTDTKTANFENTYSAGSLSVTKNVAGNLGDRSKEFNVRVTFTAPDASVVNSTISYVVDGETETIAPVWDGNTASVQIALHHEETVTFTNIPYGVTYTVEEDADSAAGYEVSYTDNQNGTIDAASDTVIVTNTKGTTVDTGVVLDSLPYVLLIAVALVGVVAFTAKKRTID